MDNEGTKPMPKGIKGFVDDGSSFIKQYPWQTLLAMGAVIVLLMQMKTSKNIIKALDFRK